MNLNETYVPIGESNINFDNLESIAFTTPIKNVGFSKLVFKTVDKKCYVLRNRMVDIAEREEIGLLYVSPTDCSLTEDSTFEFFELRKPTNILLLSYCLNNDNFQCGIRLIFDNGTSFSILPSVSPCNLVTYLNSKPVGQFESELPFKEYVEQKYIPR